MKYKQNKSLSKRGSRSSSSSSSRSSSKNVNTKLNKKRTPTKNKVKKTIQGGGGNLNMRGGGYYEPNTFNNEPIDNNMDNQQTGAGLSIFNSSNLLLLVIVLLLLTICYLLYINYNAKLNDDKLMLETEITNVLINENKNNNKYSNSKYLNNRNNRINKKYSGGNGGNGSNSGNGGSVGNGNGGNGGENFHNMIRGHRLVGEDANNPHTVSLLQPVLNHNMERVINPLLPPERSYVNTYGIPTNIPTRGFSGGFQQVGSLHKFEIADTNTTSGNNNKSIILPLYGQPLYPGANRWNYYTITDKHNSVKITFKIGNKHSDDRHGVDELMSDDNVEIPEYNGTFKVKVYQFDQPRYIPHIY